MGTGDVRVPLSSLRGKVAMSENRLRSSKWRLTPRDVAVRQALERTEDTAETEQRTALGEELRRMPIRVWQRQGLASFRVRLAHASGSTRRAM